MSSDRATARRLVDQAAALVTELQDRATFGGERSARLIPRAVHRLWRRQIAHAGGRIAPSK